MGGGDEYRDGAAGGVAPVCCGEESWRQLISQIDTSFQTPGLSDQMAACNRLEGVLETGQNSFKSTNVEIKGPY